MAGRAIRDQLETLTQLGVVGDVPDGQILGQFLGGSDRAAQAAFAVLVDRHGPMVLRVCRQWLGDAHGAGADAEDAFQATFLVLARKAGSVRKAESLASWLHGVAIKVAARARADAQRRRSFELRGGAIRLADRDADRRESWPELHEEIARLPERYRQAVVLCYLEGLTTEAAALRLGCPRGTVLSRLARAKERLRDRLARRGLAPAAPLARLGAEVPAPVPAHLIAAARALSASATAKISASILTLSAGAIHAMTIARIFKSATLILAASALFGMAGVGVHAYQAQGRDGDEKAEPAPESKPTTPTRVNPPSTVKAARENPIAPAAEAVSTSELAAQLDLARKKAARYKTLHDNNAIPQQIFDEAEGEVKILEGRVAGRIEQLEEDLELLKIRLEAKRAEQDGARAEVEAARANFMDIKTSGRANIPATAAELHGKEASLAVRAAEVREIEARIKHVERRLKALAPLLKDKDPRLADLRREEEKASERLEKVRRLARRDSDPAVVDARRRLEAIRDQIRKIEAPADPAR